MAGEQKPKSSLRRRILASVITLVMLSLISSTLSLYRVTEFNRSLDEINRFAIPLNRLITQIQSDAEILERELQRGLGKEHWQKDNWRPRSIPHWVSDVLEHEIDRISVLVEKMDQPEWKDWVEQMDTALRSVKAQSTRLYSAVRQKNYSDANIIYTEWQATLGDWKKNLKWGAKKSKRFLNDTFSRAENRVAELKDGLKIILAVVVALSLLILWMGEKALRPLSQITALARQITQRGLRKEDKSQIPDLAVYRTDEVGQLAVEFKGMATALLEREKTVENQKHRLQIQNQLLREIGELNENILNSIESILIVTDPQQKITQCNPVAAQWLGQEVDQIIGTDFFSWQKLARVKDSISLAVETTAEVENLVSDGRVFNGHVIPLRGDAGAAHGAILVLGDVSHQVAMETRLRLAENLAAVGRMGAQVAHEVRNPLHSIGLEAEVAMDLAAQTGDPQLKQTIQSILSGVDRLEKLTDNYLKISKMSSSDKNPVDLNALMDSVMATYAATIEEQKIKLDWKRAEDKVMVVGDQDLLEQAIGNIVKNAIEAVSEVGTRTLTWSVEQIEQKVFIRIEDSGNGIDEAIRDKMFSPFVTSKAQGTGLGLSFVKKVIDDHGGTVTCRGGKNGGTCFEIVLAVHAEHETHGIAKTTPEQVNDGVSEYVQ